MSTIELDKIVLYIFIGWTAWIVTVIIILELLTHISSSTDGSKSLQLFKSHLFFKILTLFSNFKGINSEKKQLLESKEIDTRQVCIYF